VSSKKRINGAVRAATNDVWNVKGFVRQLIPNEKKENRPFLQKTKRENKSLEHFLRGSNPQKYKV
jgi:hypothetical protein